MDNSRLQQCKPILRFVSAVVGIGLFALSCAGFDHASTNAASTAEARTSFGCLCFLGVCFGLLLALGETKLELFFFFFGFLRYRIGRAIVFSVAGIMIALVGKNLNDQCGCTSYAILIIEGAACMGVALLQLLAIAVFGNNSAPQREKGEATQRSNGGYNPPLNLPPLPKTASRSGKNDNTTFQPVQPSHPIPHTQSDETYGTDLPSWMNA